MSKLATGPYRRMAVALLPISKRGRSIVPGPSQPPDTPQLIDEPLSLWETRPSTLPDAKTPAKYWCTWAVRA